ncbi:hypothetical protein BaRGS_00032251 [Batillaria attramentaria]|uniref:Uncharacterized protein n=1 Tax=Batillaria attramentaria TaxID=370345 RepID=A0ABD0JP88_9CAEN
MSTNQKLFYNFHQGVAPTIPYKSKCVSRLSVSETSKSRANSGCRLRHAGNRKPVKNPHRSAKRNGEVTSRKARGALGPVVRVSRGNKREEEIDPLSRRQLISRTLNLNNPH